MKLVTIALILLLQTVASYSFSLTCKPRSIAPVGPFTYLSGFEYLLEHHLNLEHPYTEVTVPNYSKLSFLGAVRMTRGVAEEYTIGQKIGKGKFAQVFRLTHSKSADPLAIKLFAKKDEWTLRKEVQMLQVMQDAPNVLPLKGILNIEFNNTMLDGLVLDYIETLNLTEIQATITKPQLKKFLYETLKTLEYAHSKGIMHRDVKPQNILMNQANMSVKVIDWGQSEWYHPKHARTVRVSSVHYKAPELLLENEYYNYEIDIWSAGVFFAEYMFNKKSFFKSEIKRKDPNMDQTELKWLQFEDQLDAIAKILGTAGLKRVVHKYQDKIKPHHIRDVGQYAKVTFREFVNDTNRHMVDELGLDLLEKMLTWDYKKRITAKDALAHRYFDEVRD